MATCPECEFDEIDTKDYEDGDILSCPECGKNLVLVGSDDDCNLIVAPGVGLGERPTFDGSVGSRSASIPETDQA